MKCTQYWMLWAVFTSNSICLKFQLLFYDFFFLIYTFNVLFMYSFYVFVCLLACSCNAYTFQMNICWMLLTLRSFLCALIFPTKIHIKIYKRFFCAMFFFLSLFYFILCTHTTVFFLFYLFKLFFHTVFCFSWESLTIPLKLNQNCSEKLCTSVIYYVDFENCINWWKNIAWNVFVWFSSFVFFLALWKFQQKAEAKKHRLMQFVLVVTDYLIELKWNLVYVVHTRLFVCVFMCRWITLHLKGTSTATTTQKQNIRTMIDWLITAQANENARGEKICFVRSVATDWNGNYDTNRPKTNFNGKYSVSIYWYLHPNFGNRNRRSVTVNCWARICLRHTRIFVSPWSILAIQFI